MSHQQTASGFRPIGNVEHDRREAVKNVVEAWKDFAMSSTAVERRVMRDQLRCDIEHMKEVFGQ